MFPRTLYYNIVGKGRVEMLSHDICAWSIIVKRRDPQAVQCVCTCMFVGVCMCVHVCVRLCVCMYVCVLFFHYCTAHHTVATRPKSLVNLSFALCTASPYPCVDNRNHCNRSSPGSTVTGKNAVSAAINIVVIYTRPVDNVSETNNNYNNNDDSVFKHTGGRVNRSRVGTSILRRTFLSTYCLLYSKSSITSVTVRCSTDLHCTS